jgi:hypothetical protein
MRFAPWTAAWFCAFLSAITIVADLGLSFVNRQPVGTSSLTVFLCFLPMCFHYLGLSLFKQQKEIDDLRSRLDSLNTKFSG